MGIVRRMLQLAAACMIILAGTASAFALDEGPYRIAMGPTSAPMKPGGTGSSVPTCAPSDWSCPQPHRATRHRRARASQKPPSKMF
jgi:hypothetical protein